MSTRRQKALDIARVVGLVFGARASGDAMLAAALGSQPGGPEGVARIRGAWIAARRTRDGLEPVTLEVDVEPRRFDIPAADSGEQPDAPRSGAETPATGERRWQIIPGRVFWTGAGWSFARPRTKSPAPYVRAVAVRIRHRRIAAWPSSVASDSREPIEAWDGARVTLPVTIRDGTWTLALPRECWARRREAWSRATGMRVGEVPPEVLWDAASFGVEDVSIRLIRAASVVRGVEQYFGGAIVAHVGILRDVGDRLRDAERALAAGKSPRKFLTDAKWLCDEAIERERPAERAERSRRSETVRQTGQRPGAEPAPWRSEASAGRRLLERLREILGASVSSERRDALRDLLAEVDAARRAWRWARRNRSPAQQLWDALAADGWSRSDVARIWLRSRASVVEVREIANASRAYREQAGAEECPDIGPAPASALFRSAERALARNVVARDGGPLKRADDPKPADAGRAEGAPGRRREDMAPGSADSRGRWAKARQSRAVPRGTARSCNPMRNERPAAVATPRRRRA